MDLLCILTVFDGTLIVGSTEENEKEYFVDYRGNFYDALPDSLQN